MFPQWILGCQGGLPPLLSGRPILEHMKGGSPLICQLPGSPLAQFLPVLKGSHLMDPKIFLSLQQLGNSTFSFMFSVILLPLTWLHPTHLHKTVGRGQRFQLLRESREEAHQRQVSCGMFPWMCVATDHSSCPGYGHCHSCTTH